MTRIKRENVYPTPGRGNWFRFALLAAALIAISYFAFQEGSDDPDSLLGSSTSQMLRVDLPDAQIEQKSKMEKYFEGHKANPDGDDADGDDADGDDADGDDADGADADGADGDDGGDDNEGEDVSEGDDEGEAEAEGGDDDGKE
jgi:hypothetical protein